MGQRLPQLVARLAGRAQVEEAVQAALDEGLAFLPLERAAQGDEPHALALLAPGAGGPIWVLAEPAGEPTDGLYPLVLHPLGAEGRAALEAFLAPAAPPAPLPVRPGDPRAGAPSSARARWEAPAAPARADALEVDFGGGDFGGRAVAARADALEVDFGGGGAFELDTPGGSADDAAAFQAEPPWVVLERMTANLVRDPDAVFSSLSRVQNDLDQLARDMRPFTKALLALAERGEAPALLHALSRLSAWSRGAPPGDRSGEGLAAQALAAVRSTDPTLVPIAHAALEGAPAARDAARKVLVWAGAVGARALCTARAETARPPSIRPGGARAAPPEPAPEMRERFVAALRELGPNALGELAAVARQSMTGDAAFAEDVLRGMAPAGAPSPPRAVGAAETAAGEAATLALRHEQPAVRAAAVAALASLWGPNAHPRIAPLLKTDADDRVRASVIGALSRTGGIDRDTIFQLDALLTMGAPPPSGTVAAGDEARLAAATALGEVGAALRPQAAGVLARALKPPAQGLLGKLTGGEKENAALLVALSRALLTVGGADAKRVVEVRAARAAPDVKQKLLDLVAGRG